MTGNRSLFISLQAMDGGQVTFADNSKARIIGVEPIAADVPMHQLRGDNSDRGGRSPRTGQQATTAEYPRPLVGGRRPRPEKQSKRAISSIAKGKRKLASLPESQIIPSNARGGIMIGKRRRMSLEEESDKAPALEKSQDVLVPAEGYDSDDPFIVLYNKATELIPSKEKRTIDYRKSVRELSDILNHNLDDIASNPSLRETLLEYINFFEAAPTHAMSLEMRKSINFICSQCRSILFSYDTSKSILDRLYAFERKKDAMVQRIEEGEKKFKAIRKQQRELLKGREQLDTLEEEIARLREELEKKEKKAERLNESLKTQDKKLKDLRETNDDLNKEASWLDAALDSLLTEYEGIQVEGEEAQAEQGHLRSSWQALKVKFDVDRSNYGGTNMI